MLRFCLRRPPSCDMLPVLCMPPSSLASAALVSESDLSPSCSGFDAAGGTIWGR